MSKAKYYEMCETLRIEPNEKDMPVDLSDFPFLVQQLIIIFNTLPSMYQDMTGVYMGKDFSLLPYLFKVEGIEDEKSALLVIRLLNDAFIPAITAIQKQKAEVTKKGGKNGRKRGKNL